MRTLHVYKICSVLVFHRNRDYEAAGVGWFLSGLLYGLIISIFRRLFNFSICFLTFRLQLRVISELLLFL